MNSRRPLPDGPTSEPTGELASSLKACRAAFIALAVASALINVLYLTGSVYMLEVYDRVLPSRSIPTLVGLSVLALILFSFQGFLDLIRSRILTRVGGSLSESLSARVYEAIGRLALQSAWPRRWPAAAA